MPEYHAGSLKPLVRATLGFLLLYTASNFTSDIEKELSDLTLTIEREMERQMEDSQKQQNEYFGVCAKCNKGYFLESSPSNYIFRLINVFFFLILLHVKAFLGVKMRVKHRIKCTIINVSRV